MPVLKQNDVYAGRYILDQIIGEGGFSEVWKARDLMADDAVVAIKIYAPSKGLDDYGLRQFRNEFSITYNLSHPHLLKVNHFDIAEGSPYLIMPYCPYGSLTSELEQGGTFSEQKVALVMYQIGSALEEIHSQDPPIIHQDIKPDNILLLHPKSFVLADFGVSSRFRHTLRKATSDSTQTLTIAYAPPERFDRHPSADPSSDIFSLGVTLYEMCTDKVPWEGAGGQCLLKGASVPALPQGFSPELNKILEACMQADRSKRPTAAEISGWGKHFLETGQWNVPKKKKGAEPAKKSYIPFMAAAVVVLLVAMGGLWLYIDYNSVSAANTKEGTAAAEMANSAASLGEGKAEDPVADKLKTMEAQLVKANQQLLLQDSLNQVLAQYKDAQVVKDQAASSRENMSATQQGAAQQARAVSKAEKLRIQSRELQRYLNQISDPKHSRELRSGWKQEALSRFADGSVRVLDESDGSLKEYRAAVFLTLLFTSPHQVVVREIKTDQRNKVTEVRLAKQPLSASM
ncbi:serine/threonine-protein kinase [Cesiribacter sp. SM1]|uniref:serine/threonine-protein kinase n=1 Tax=Cesiribacter sp. SM1 TaxID=2861196 RepID=UPI001CD41037|nr:serine/threonine-protein kinase [Cesiribacter sp. SM1]